MTIEEQLAAAVAAEKNAKQKIKELKHAKKIANEGFPEHKLAIMLHNAVCGFNHIDACDWYYDVNNGVHNWQGHAHQKYLIRARNIVKHCECIGLNVSQIEQVTAVILES